MANDLRAFHDTGAADVGSHVARACAAAPIVSPDSRRGPSARPVRHDHGPHSELLRDHMAPLFLLAATVNVWVLVLILTGAFGVQLIAGEPPCPLCVVQRIALMMCALGPLYLLLQARDRVFSFRDLAVGNGICIIAALLGAAVSTRQVLLHILPGDPGFGSPVLGL